MKTDYNNNYFRWLYEYVNPEERDTYFNLLWILFDIPFYYDIPMDENREGEILEMRGNYSDRNPDYSGDIPNDCSVLELMIILANHMEFQDLRTHQTGEVGPYFWEMIDNLGLHQYNDDYIESVPDAEEQVRICINDMLQHNYSRTGQGSLFPVTASRKNRTRMQLWDQMSSYLLKQ